MKLELAVVVLVAACGADSKPAAPDAAVAPSPGDAAAVDAPPVAVDAPATGTVAIIARNLGTEGNRDLPVSFADRDGTPTTLVHTDANGFATATITAGDSATLVVSSPGGATVYTTLDLQPGDAIVIEGPAVVGAARGTVKVAVPALDGAASYTISAGCVTSFLSAGAGTANLALGADCISSTDTYDLGALAFDADGHILAYQTKFDLAPPVIGTSANVDLGGWHTDVAKASVALTNPPPGTTTITASVGPLRDQRLFQVVTGQSALPQTFDLVAPGGAWSGYRVLVLGEKTPQSLSAILRGIPALDAPIAIDLSADALPFLHDVAIDQPGPSPRIELVADGSLANARGLLAEYQYHTDFGTVTGIVTMPASQDTRDLPRFPDGLANLRPPVPFAGDLEFVYALAGTAWVDATAFREHSTRFLLDRLHVLPAVGQELRLSAAVPAD